MLDRLRGYLRDQNFEVAQVEAVLAVSNGTLHEVLPRLRGVKNFAALDVAKDLAAANKRVRNIMRKNAEELGDLVPKVANPNLFEDEAERELYQAIQDIAPMAHRYYEQGDYSNNLKTLVTLKPFIDDFFDNVMVMAEQQELRINRAALLQQLGRLMNQSADISKLVV